MPAPSSPLPPRDHVPEAAVLLFRSLGDPTRLAILQHLALAQHRVVDLTAHLGLAQSTVSAHLAPLRDCGLVSSRAVGRAPVFALTVPHELAGPLAAAERVLAVTDVALALRTTPGAAPATTAATSLERHGSATSGRPFRSDPRRVRPEVRLPVRRRSIAGGPH